LIRESSIERFKKKNWIIRSNRIMTTIGTEFAKKNLGSGWREGGGGSILFGH
jgi:hypothetical protein